MITQLYYKSIFFLGVVLNLLAMGLPDVITFDFMSPPSEDSLKDALRQLVQLGAVESIESQKVSISFTTH